MRPATDWSWSMTAPTIWSLYRKGQADDSGTVQVGPGNAEPLLNVFSDVENVDFVDENGNAIVNAVGGPQLVVFKHDPFESNDDRFTATYLGSGDTINVDPTIDPGPLANPFGDGQNLAGDQRFLPRGRRDDRNARLPGLLPPSSRPGQRSTGPAQRRQPGHQRAAMRRATSSPGLAPTMRPMTNGFGSRPSKARPITCKCWAAATRSTFTTSPWSITHRRFRTHLELLDNPADGTTNPPGTSTNSDTGRSQFDNHTYDNTPTLFFRLDDGIFLNDLPGNPATDSPPDEIIPIPFQAGIAQPITPGYAIAIFDEGDTLPQTGTAPQTPLGFATASGTAGRLHLYRARCGRAQRRQPLPDRARADDRSGQSAADRIRTAQRCRWRSSSIDTDRQVAFGLATDAGDGLHPDSDSGDPAVPDTLVDRITNDETPTFFGRAEANSIVRAVCRPGRQRHVDRRRPVDRPERRQPARRNRATGNARQSARTGRPMGDHFHGQHERSPNPDGAGADQGRSPRTILLSAEDLAGNITAPDANETLDIFIDTQGPQVTDVFITDVPGFNLFTLKPETPQPTPRVDSLTISFRDLPPRVAPVPVQRPVQRAAAGTDRSGR